MIGGNLESTFDQHLKMGSISVGQTDVFNLSLLLENFEVYKVEDVGVVGIIPNVV